MTVERLAWDTFLDRLTWRQGEHVALIGPTGAGKTTLALALLPRRKYVIAFGTKPEDRTLDRLVRDGWRLVREHDQIPRVIMGKVRIVFWPKFRTVEDQQRQGHQIGQVMAEAFRRGGWCLYVDELWWLTKIGLGPMVEVFLTQGRSIGLSLVVGVQRPAHVTLLIYDQPTHLFFWRENDERNLKRIAGINGLNARLIRDTVQSLPKHDVLYVNTRTGEMLVTRAPK